MATILVLDDRPDNREFLTTLLGYMGYQLLEAIDAEQGLAQVRSAHPDLVIADVLMPNVDGFEFVRLLRADPSIAQTRVIFYTAAYLETEVHQLARACGVEHVLIKPAEPQELLAVIQRVLGTPAPMIATPPAEEFAQEHQRVLLGKLGQKIEELELLNAELETRVAARTAELAEANAHLRELDLFKDNMLAIASHDLRSPLSAIQNMAEILTEEMELSEPAHRMTQNIFISSRHLIGIVSQLLDLARLEAGKIELEPAMLQVSEVTRRTLDALQTSAQSKTITTMLVVEPGEPPIAADCVKLSQILTNLISNAIKFTQPGGHICVTIATESPYLRIQVADTGVGIPPEDQPYLFEKFRHHTLGTSGERGSGLGLAIVRQLVDLHGGTIEVASAVPYGSTFTIRLPIPETVEG